MNVPRTLATKSRKRAIDGMQPFFVLAFVSRATSFSNASIQMWIKQIYSLCVGKVLQLLDGNNVQAGRLSYRGRKRSYISVPAPTRIALSWAESYVREESLSPPPPYAAGGTHPLRTTKLPGAEYECEPNHCRYAWWKLRRRWHYHWRFNCGRLLLALAGGLTA